MRDPGRIDELIEELRRLYQGNEANNGGTMRDPDRIDVIIEELRRLWKAVPDWRLGQLVVNCSSSQPFYIEDDDMLQAIRELQRQIDQSKN